LSTAFRAESTVNVAGQETTLTTLARERRLILTSKYTSTLDPQGNFRMTYEQHAILAESPAITWKLAPEAYPALQTIILRGKPHVETRNLLPAELALAHGDTSARRYRRALERLASSEALTMPITMPGPMAEELRALMKLARQALTESPTEPNPESPADSSSRRSPRIHVRVKFADSRYDYTTPFNGTIDEARSYFVGQPINFGDRDWGDGDNIQRPTSVEEVP
jgi:hypothetical protein